MKYDFDQEIRRTGTNSVKWQIYWRGDKRELWEGTDPDLGAERTLPMWVADMDFQIAEPIRDAMRARIDHPIFGYVVRTPDYNEAITGWMERRHGWKVDPDWIVNTPGVVPALNLLVRALTEPGDKVLIQRPVYYPFTYAIENNGREVVSNSLVMENGVYRMDFDDLEAKTADPKVKLCVFCSPHNPVGRVWTEEELKRFGEICKKNGVVVIADEIHGDLMLNGATFVPFGKLGADMMDNAIVCTAPSKTFNLAGLHTSNMIVSNETYRKALSKEIAASGIGGMNSFGLVATMAAYNEGEEWLEQVLDYLSENANHLESFVAERIPEIKVVHPEGTYLVWLDCRGLGLDKLELEALMHEEAKVLFDEGYVFGTEGEGFERINIACPRSILTDALERIEAAVAKRRA